ncbi:putative glycosyl [Golovinomyces cichoracearum]|uniref:Putative glycosyl n=1 Tax=Golovinomyces cichoracearum TaxID=62708 RepID=A0A420HZD8_9PEZI|nr:putative glycosyl [Golovinomyces cichoracearum]
MTESFEPTMRRNNVNEEITGSLDITVMENLTEANLNGMAYWFMQSYDEKSVSLTTDAADVYQEPYPKPLTRSQKRTITFESNRNSSSSQNPLDNLSNIKQERIDQRTQESTHYSQTSHPQYASKTQQELQGEWDNKEEDRRQQTKEYSTLASQFSRKLGNLAIFYNDDMKCGGAEDSLDICLDIFEDTCLNTGLPPIAYSLGTPTMLKGNARKYYYHRISKPKLGHEGSTKRLREHFEMEARRQDHLTQWHDLSLQVIVHDNPEKSLMECFEMLLDKLHKLQGGLSEKMRNDESARDRLQVACQMIPACSKACFAPNPTFEGLTAEIRNAISTEGRLVRVNASYKGNLAYANFTDRNFRGPH